MPKFQDYQIRICIADGDPDQGQPNQCVDPDLDPEYRTVLKLTEINPEPLENQPKNDVRKTEQAVLQIQIHKNHTTAFK